MSTWMSIGFDPDQGDPTTETSTQVAISGARNDAAPRQTGGLDQAKPGEFEAVSGLNGSTRHWIAGAINHLAAGQRKLGTQRRSL
jgi:hypothetical protein